MALLCRRPALLPTVLCLAFWLAGCAGNVAPEPPPPVGDRLFTQMPSSYTRVAFENRLSDTEQFNVFTYRNYYDGGGVGLGDFNGDGLVDLYFTANQLPNRLYLNRGAFRFDDVTDRAGVAGRHKWATGVSVADVDGDGRLDLYVCNSGDVPGDDRANELFINQGADSDGVPTFEERAADVGLADRGHSTHAAFFDYDKDGDLDLYLMNNTSRPISSFKVQNVRHVRHEGGGDKLYRNDLVETGTLHFTDVSEAAGIYGSEIGFGLGVTAGDVDGDGWTDLYISNDFFERDYLYLNQRDGTFREDLEARMPHISLSSMGADMADLNNDGLPEIYVTDMLPEDDRRLKTTSTFDPWRVYRAGLDNGFYHQFMRNTLQFNNGAAGAGQAPTFSEIAQIAGVASTDWSWSALLADFDNDGFKDIFVANGVFRDLTDQDFIAAFSTEEAIMQWIREEGPDLRKLLPRIPSTPLPNYAFANDLPLRDDRLSLTFTNRADAWGLASPGFSNGSAYGDLDNDGDLDLVVNNLNAEAFVYRNEADTLLGHHFLQVQLEGEGRNRFGIGAKVTLRHGGAVYYLEQMPTRGFQSSVDPVLTFGLGDLAAVDTLVVVWPDDRAQHLTGVAADRRLRLRQADARPGAAPTPRAAPPPLFADVTAATGLAYTHRENDFVDFDREGLLFKMISTEGPRLATADVNGDGLADLFVGGAKESPGRLFVQRRGGGFASTNEVLFERDKISEDLGAVFFDADGDGDADLYVVSGGSEFSELAPALKDRLYLNDGRGAFEKTFDRLPALYTSGSCVVAADYDGDGDVDLFVGGRVVPWRYGFDPPSTLLQNDGRGRFTDVTEALAPALARLGMVTDAAWTDADGDGRLDLVVVGEWMPVTLLRNAGGGALVAQATGGLEKTHGLWNRLLADDFDGDGDVDFVAGNLGRNTRLRADETEPLTMLVHDFDGNGWAEQILSLSQNGTSYPMPLRGALVAQLPFLAARFPTHAAYAGRPLDDLFTPEERAGAVVREVYTVSTSYVENLGQGAFRVTPLPYLAQLSPVYGLLAGDFDGDGHKDLLLGGNFDAVQPELGRMDASYGLFLRGDGAGGFTPVLTRHSGFFVTGQVRDMAWLEVPGQGRLILIARNDGPLQVFRTTGARRGT